MPARDATGPRGQGPMTGRGRGRCSGAGTPDPIGRPGFGGGPAGTAPAAGRCGSGRGYRNRFYATGLPLWARGPDAQPYPGAADEVTSLLKNEAEALRTRLSGIEERLKGLESE
jgi:hypothetical protein